MPVNFVLIVLVVASIYELMEMFILVCLAKLLRPV